MLMKISTTFYAEIYRGSLIKGAINVLGIF